MSCTDYRGIGGEQQAVSVHVQCRLYSGGYHRNCMEEVSNAVHCTKVASNVLYQEMALVCGTPVVIAVL